MSDLILKIDGLEFGGWTSVEVTRSLEEAAGQFRLDLTDRWPGHQDRRPIEEHLSCEVTLGGETVLVGVIDEVDPSYDATDHSISVSGRSMPGQLVDCSCEFASGELKNLSMAAIAQKLADPFDVEVVDLAGATKPFSRVTVEQGETAIETLERLARQRAVFLTDDAEGRLVIRRRSTALQGALKKGGNVLRASARLAGQDQYSTYRVLGQREGRDGLGTEASTRTVGVAVDASVPIHRPLIVLSETQGNAGSLKERAEHEAALRRARARRWRYTVAGWARPDGELWRIAEEVEITDDFMGFEETRMLVVEVQFTKGDDGTLTELTIAPPEGYDLVAERETVAARVEKFGWVPG